MDHQRIPFAEIKHLLPGDAWAAWRNELNQSEFDDEPVIVFESSTVLDLLNLDFPSDETEHIFLILVKGNLTVKRYVYNEETDGAVGLIVLGDLRAGNMLVGGQEVYVTGDLMVDEVFWGDYNHGDLHVLGMATAKVFVETDEYSVNVTGQTKFGHYLDQYGTQDNNETGESGGNYQGLNEKLARELFTAEFIFVEDDEIVLVRDETILARLEAGHSLLRGLD
ncbi:hypothetical protein [Hymenobacter coccineus]|uniref:hypothetical protein n=1 Tax=Hymenobacter coccineus TaxID=1908235 RepID=UPI000F7A3846|nr:hypothetical protein [Hymenobacter coccineus]